MSSKHNKSLFGLLSKFRGVDKPTYPMSAAVIRDWLINRLAKQLSLQPETIDTSETFAAYGLDSIVAVQVSGELEKLVEQRLSPALLFEHPSIDALTHHLAEELNLPETA